MSILSRLSRLTDDSDDFDDTPAFTGPLPGYPCVHGTFDPITYCVCEDGWITAPKPITEKNAAACNDTDWSSFHEVPQSKPVDFVLIAKLAVLGALVLVLLGLLVRRYVVPPPPNTEMGPLSDGQKECLARCESYLDSVQQREPHFVPAEAAVRGNADV